VLTAITDRYCRIVRYCDIWHRLLDDEVADQEDERSKSILIEYHEGCQMIYIYFFVFNAGNYVALRFFEEITWEFSI